MRGIYQHVRNPMITGVLLIIAGESAFFGSKAAGVFAAVVFGINALYIPLVEEARLNRRFGSEYEAYARHVPRWVPRRSAWRPTSEQ